MISVLLGVALPTPEGTRLEVCARAMHAYAEPRWLKRLRASVVMAAQAVLDVE